MVIRILSLLCLISLTPFTAMAQDAIPENRQQIQLSFAPVVKKVTPAVVNIYTKRKVNVRGRSPFSGDPFFSMFFDDRMFGGAIRQRIEKSLGSGVILDKKGLIITNAHVIKDAQEITVILRDGQEYEATLALQDDASDLALLRLKNVKSDLPFVTLKPSETLEVGDLVLAIGNPFGVGQTVTSGIVSAQGRSALDVNDFNFFIQTDAAINPGNSGGALVTLDGKVVGINSAIYSRDGGSLGIGFAIPSEMVNSIITAEAQGQSGSKGITRPWLGIEAQEMTSDIAESLGLKRPTGVLIASLHPASPLKKAGIKKGDIIIDMNGKPLHSPQEMKFRMATVALGNTANMRILRDEKMINFDIEAIAPPNAPPRNETRLSGQHPLSGVTLSNLNPAVAVELGLPIDSSGVVVTAIAPRSRANRITRNGDLITQINGADIKTVKDALTALEQGGATGWNLVINSNGRSQRIILR